MDIPQPHATKTLPIIGSDQQFPVRRIFCIGRNYLAHALEMGTHVDKKTMSAFYFCKDAESVLVAPAQLQYPSRSTNVQHEVELVVALGKGGSLISESDALQHIFGYCVGIDLTRRDLQAEAKSEGLPWDTSKNFDDSAILGPITRAESFGEPSQQQISLRVNGETRQQSKINLMIWNIPEIIADLSRLYHLRAGDLIFTGTPEGVSPIAIGDCISASVEGLSSVEIEVIARRP